MKKPKKQVKPRAPFVRSSVKATVELRLHLDLDGDGEAVLMAVDGRKSVHFVARMSAFQFLAFVRGDAARTECEWFRLAHSAVGEALDALPKGRKRKKSLIHMRR